MRYKAVITYAALAIVVPLNAAAHWGIVSSCPTPCTEPRGLCGDLLVGDGPEPYVYSVHLGNGSVFSSFPAPGGPGAWGISDADVEYELYLSNNRTSWIYKITTSGSILSSFSCPLPGPAGIGYAYATRLEVAIPSMNIIAIVNPITGSLLSTIPGPGLKPTACSGWGGSEFITDAGTHAVYLNRHLIIEGIETPTGIWYEQAPSDTGAYWFVFIVDAATKRVYEYNDNVAVAPASLGRVKALFR